MLDAKQLAERKALLRSKINPNSDFEYYTAEVEVHRVTFTDGSKTYVPKHIGKKIQNAMVEENNSSVITLGDSAWRVYEFKNVVSTVVRFVELSDWAKYQILKENPKMFDEWYQDFTEKLKEKIDDLKAGKNLSNDLRLF